MKLQTENKKPESQYEKNQDFNLINRYLHSLRYKNLVQTINNFQVNTSRQGKIIKILDIGSGFGRTFSTLDEKFNIDYWGIELFKECHETACERYGEKNNFHNILGSALDREVYSRIPEPDIVTALETFEHLPERDLVRLIEFLADTVKPQLLIASVPVEIGPIIWIKNIGSFITGYARNGFARGYTLEETFWAGLYQLDKLPVHGRGEGVAHHKGFDHRWLTQTIRQNFKILEIRKFPFNFLPASLATSLFIVAVTRE
jgi:SAM-dependent methyltransferase